MNKSELSEKIAERPGGLNKAQVEMVIDSFIDITIDELKRGGEVSLTGFGTFSARKRKGREGINPRNPQQKIAIPAVVVAKFKAGKHLKDALKGEVGRTETISEPEPAAIEPSSPEA